MCEPGEVRGYIKAIVRPVDESIDADFVYEARE
jgi:hypothetical protein